MNILLYDSDCGACSRSVRFILKRDPEGVIRFAGIRSELGGTLLAERGIRIENLDTMYFVTGNGVLERSDAAIKVCMLLPKLRWLGRLLSLFPRGLRDWGYDTFARNRHRFFKHSSCELPSAETTERFLDHPGPRFTVPGN